MGMKTLELKEFKGIDHRLHRDIADQRTVLVADNVDMTTGGGFRCRDQLRKVATLDARSLGLYSLNGALRTALPYAAGTLVGESPFPFTYDVFVTDKTPTRLASVCSWDGHAYLDVEVTDGSKTTYEHHFCELGEQSGVIWLNPFGVSGGQTQQFNVTSEIPHTEASEKVGATVVIPNHGSFVIASATDTTITTTLPVTGVSLLDSLACAITGRRVTLVDVPFVPGPTVLTAAGKIFADDLATNNISFSSTQNGPRDWISANDAGFLAAANNADGARQIKAMATWFNKLIVFNTSSAQAWSVDPDPANMSFFATIGGAGIQHTKAIANVQGDLVFYGRNAFRSISSNQYTGQPKTQNALGIAIKDLTANLDPKVQNLCSLWYPARDQYLCFNGNKVFVYLAADEKQGWTTYTLPITVTACAELDNQVYVRDDAGNVYVFDAEGVQEPGFAFDLRTQFLMGDADNIIKKWNILALVGTGGPVAVDFGLDSADDAKVRKGFSVSNGSTNNKGRYPIMVTDPSLQIRFSGTSKTWTLDAIFVYYESGALL